jgi:hypothetical protein
MDDESDDNAVFEFDGKTTAVEVPKNELEPRHLGLSFSISTWMKHDRPTTDDNVKEHILCAADGEGMNRHHYSIFVHNCRLVLLLRHEPPEVTSLDELSPAEWRWKLPEVCDGSWHHYVISVEASKIRLHLDGRAFVPDEAEFEVLEDWPLHRSKLTHSVRTYVGACWQGSKARTAHHFRGYLSGLIVLKNATDSDQTVECLNKCQEKLELAAIDSMEPGMSVSVNAAQNELTINGQSTEAVQKQLRQLNYVNSRLFPTAAVRPLAVETHIKCVDGRQPTYDVISVSIDVRQPAELVLKLNATTSVLRDEHHLVVGDNVFYDLTIVGQEKLRIDDTELIDVTDKLRLGLCHVHLEPVFDLDVEHLTLTSNLVERLQLEMTSSETGLTISGVASVSDYEEILRSLIYVNSRPHDYNKRQFVVGCTEAGDHVTSNQLRITLDIVHQQPVAAAAHPQHLMREPKPVMADSLRLVGKSFPNALKYDSQQTGIGVAVVMIVCVGFIIVLIVLGVIRVRNARRCGSSDQYDDDDEPDDLDWDNSALTITVNPMHPDNADELDDGADCSDIGDTDDDDECDTDDEAVVYRDVTVASRPKSSSTLAL